MDAPRTTYLATGDLDGDGKTDLVGTGSVLWVALSSHQTAAAPPLAATVTRPKVENLVINEILSNNSSVPVPDPAFTDGTIYGTVDAVELFNGGAGPVTLNGWKLQLITVTETKEFIFPAGKVLAAGERHMLLATTNTTGSPWATGFPLPKEGATLCLCGPGGTVDTVEYPPLPANQSYARFADGDPAFHVNQLPDPGRTNIDNGAVEPAVSLHGVSLAHFSAGERVRFYAKAKDDVGIVGLLLKYRVRDQPGAKFENAPLYDDGMNGDGGRLDGVFSGLLEAAIPAGTELEFYLEGEDLSGAKKYVPGLPPEAADENNGTQFYTLTLPGAPTAISGLEIAEAVSNNQSGLIDEKQQIEDWIELRNSTNAPLSLGGVELTQRLFDSTARFVFPAGFTLAPHAYAVVFCDDDKPTGAILHAPFKLSGSDGEEIHLIARSANGTQQLLDFIQLPALPPNVAYARLGVGGPFVQTVPTPQGPNAPAGGSVHLVPGADGGSESIFAFPGGGRVDASYDLNSWTTVLPWVSANGVERLYRETVDSPQRFFRVR